MEDPNKFNIKSFRIIKDFIIEIVYEDGKIQVVDFQKIQYQPWWKDLENPAYFRQVRINEIKNLEWPDGQDFMPEHLYYWEKYEKFYIAPSNFHSE